jgi:hypothetical protein
MRDQRLVGAQVKKNWSEQKIRNVKRIVSYNDGHSSGFYRERRSQRDN